MTLSLGHELPEVKLLRIGHSRIVGSCKSRQQFYYPKVVWKIEWSGICTSDGADQNTDTMEEGTAP